MKGGADKRLYGPAKICFAFICRLLYEQRRPFLFSLVILLTTSSVSGMWRKRDGEFWVEIVKKKKIVAVGRRSWWSRRCVALLLFPQLSPVSGKPRTISHVLMKFPLAGRHHLLFHIVRIWRLKKNAGNAFRQVLLKRKHGGTDQAVYNRMELKEKFFKVWGCSDSWKSHCWLMEWNSWAIEVSMAVAVNAVPSTGLSLCDGVNFRPPRFSFIQPVQSFSCVSGGFWGRSVIYVLFEPGPSGIFFHINDFCCFLWRDFVHVGRWVNTMRGRTRSFRIEAKTCST